MTFKNYTTEWYRKYSEIEYFLTSDLRNSIWGIERLLQRITLFDKTKQHIPYLLLIHLIYYETGYNKAYKSEAISKLISELYRNIFKKAGRNPLFDFLPPYYVILLLSELHMNGYKIDLLLRKFEPNSGENPVITLGFLGNYSIDGFPETLFYIFTKLVSNGRIGDGTLSRMAVSAILSQNFKGFYYLLAKIRNDDYKVSPLLYATVAHINRNEIDLALKIEKSLKTFYDRCTFYVGIAKALADNGKINILNELKLINCEPGINVSLLAGMIRFYFRAGNQELASRLFEEATQDLGLIKDKLVRSIQTVSIIDVALFLGKQELLTFYLDELSSYMEHFNNEEERGMVRQYLLQILLYNNQKEKARDLNNLWNKDIYNNNIEIQIAISAMLRRIHHKTRHINSLRETPDEDLFVSDYKVIFDAIELLDGDLINFKDESRYYVSLNMAKNGLYKQASEMSHSMKEEYFTKRIITSIPFYALNNGHIEQAIDFAKEIADERARFDVLLCIAPYLDKINRHEESFEMIRNWAIYNFDTL